MDRTDEIKARAATPPSIRFLISIFLTQPGRLACWLGLAFSLYLTLNMIYGVGPMSPKRPVQLAGSLGVVVIGFAMVISAAVLKRRTDETLTDRQKAALAGLGMLTEVLTELSALLMMGIAYCFFGDHRTAALHLALGLFAAVFALWVAYRFEKRLEQDQLPEETKPNMPRNNS